VWGIIPVLSDAEIRNIRTAPEKVKNASYTSINIIRATLGRQLLTRDIDLDKVAQKKADYMAQNKDFAHVTKDGRGIKDFAKSL
jgi:uncharacterized protein YkwD